MGASLAPTFRTWATGAEGSGSNLGLTKLTSTHTVGKLRNPTELSLSYKMGLVIIPTPKGSVYSKEACIFLHDIY